MVGGIKINAWQKPSLQRFFVLSFRPNVIIIPGTIANLKQQCQTLMAGPYFEQICWGRTKSINRFSEVNDHLFSGNSEINRFAA